MAQVFLAQSIGVMGFQRLVALKLIHENFTQDPEFVKMFIDEARIAMHLHHRNIVQVFDLDEINGTYFIAMEYIRGINLYNLYERLAARKRWFEVPLALHLVAEVCKGLHFAHTRTGLDSRPLSIIHRDVSPQNVLLSFEGEVKITDFGIATASEKLHQTADGVVKGKYAYMAPERVNDASFDARVDVFSTGVLLYELLTGENPFARNSAAETIEAILCGHVPAPSIKSPHISRRLDEICLKALAKDPYHRWPTASAFADALTELAMELTFARKHRSSGDGALSRLLAELCPTAKNPVVQSLPCSLELPGIHNPSYSYSSIQQERQQFVDENPVPTLFSQDLVENYHTTASTQLPDEAWYLLEPNNPDTTQREPVLPEGLLREAPFTTSQQPMSFAIDISSSILEGPEDTNITGEGPTIAKDPAHLSRGGPREVNSRYDTSILERPHKFTTNQAHQAVNAPQLHRFSLCITLFLLGGALFTVGAWALSNIHPPSEPTKLSLNISTTPPGAKVYFQQQLLAGQTPLHTTLIASPSAPIKLTFLLKNYKTITRELSAEERERGNVEITFSPRQDQLRPRRMITLRPKKGRWSHVFLDGIDKGSSPVTLDLPTGIVELEVTWGKSKQRRSIRISVPSEGPASIL